MLVKKDMLRYVQNVRAVRGMGQGLSDHHVVLCKDRLVGTSLRREMCWMELGGLKVRNWGNNNVEQMSEQVKRAMVETVEQSGKSFR